MAMELRTRTLLMWTGVVCLCFVGIPFHLKGRERENLELAFKNYSSSFNKTYDPKSFESRLLHFQKSLQRIQQLNAEEEDNMRVALKSSSKLQGSLDADSSETLQEFSRRQKWRPGRPKNEGFALYGLTEFSDISPDEFQKKYLNPEIHRRIELREKHSSSDPHHHHHHHHKTEVRAGALQHSQNTILRRRRRALSFPGPIPDKVDWRQKGVLTPVLHQKSCGACWAFSTVETVESMRAIEKGVLEPLSVQQVIDCASNGNMGCNGGDTCGALSWMVGTKLVPAAKYPLTLQDAPCKLRSSNEGVQIRANYTCDNYVGAEDQLLTVLANHGPVAVAVDATNWQFYVGGVIQWNCDSKNNHAVQIVGYDKTAKLPHYIVRNSWGEGFGDKGYMYIAIGSNLCGIAREVSSLSVQ